jgi:succinyl-CoA synthetase alpha subunit
MGHAGAIVSGGSGAAADMFGALQEAGFEMAESPADIGNAVTRAMARGV